MTLRPFLATLLLPLCAGIGRALPPELPDGLYAEIGTPRGPVTARLFADEAPLTVTSFVGLAEGTLGPRPGAAYFDGLTFHRVVPGFVVQGGDPRGDGAGGPGYTFPDEFSPVLRHDRAGVLSMANSGPDTNGSQFFITLAETNRLNYLHSVFGVVVDGLDVLPRIAPGDTMTVRIHRLGPAARSFAADQAAFAARAAVVPRAVPPHLDDPDRLLPAQPDWARILGHKLANLQRFLGVSFHVQLLATLPPDGDGPALAADLAHRARIGTAGVAAVYVADSHLWFLRLGSDPAARLTRADEAPAAAVNRLLAEIDAAAEVLRARYGDETPPPDQFRKRHLDALIDTLIPWLEPPAALSPKDRTAP